MMKVYVLTSNRDVLGTYSHYQKAMNDADRWFTQAVGGFVQKDWQLSEFESEHGSIWEAQYRSAENTIEMAIQEIMLDKSIDTSQVDYDED
jgi:hypothetical protein